MQHNGGVRMRKNLCFFLIIITLLVLCGCTSQNEDNNSATQKPIETSIFVGEWICLSKIRATTKK